MKIDLNKGWKFKIDTLKEGADKKWYEKDVPEDAIDIKVPGFWEEKAAPGYDGWGWYFNSFEISDPDQKLALVFNGVDDDAEVYINGKWFGSHKGYSEGFYFDVSNKFKKGINTIAVLVNDYSGGGGIYKPVFIRSYQNEEDLLITPFAKMQSLVSPKWVKEGIIYEIYVRSFTKEGNFKGVTKRLDELKDLGATILWLMPIYPVGQLNKKGELGSPYAVKDYYGINHEFGTGDDLKELITEAHKRGMKLILDVVLNHTSWDNELIKTHPDWYTKNDKGEITYPIGTDWSDVADLNYDSKELRNYMKEMLAHWIKEYDVDGFRCDVAELVPTDFWEETHEYLLKQKEIMMLAEGTLPEYHIKSFDMTYAWNTYDVIKNIVDGKQTPEAFYSLLKNESYSFPQNSLRMRFSENHDKDRAVGYFGKDEAKAFAVIMNTIPGAAMIYNGMEAGDSVKPSLFDKYDIPWDKISYADEFRNLYKSLFSLRKENSAIVYGSFEKIENSEKGLMTFGRRNNTDEIIVFVNCGEKIKGLNLKELVKGKNLSDYRTFIAEKTSIQKEDNNTANVNLDKYGYIIFTKSK
jgi:glycosidase